MAFQLPNFRQIETFAGKLEKSKLWLFLGFTALYSFATYNLSIQKLMWNDELYTYYIATLPTMTDVWGALGAGGEQLPPFFYLITRASVGLFGINTAAFRLPEMIGFWVMCLCLFIFVARRTSTFYGLLAAFFPLVTYSYYYSFEARPYGLLLGFSALALLCWQSMIMNRFRLFSIIGLTLSLAAALSVHYYGIFVIFPLALGETVRTLTKRKMDAPVWASFCLAVVPLIWHLSLIKQARANSGIFWAQAKWMNIPEFYVNTLYLTVLPFVCLISLAGIYQAMTSSNLLGQNQPATLESKPQIYEVAAAVGFVIIPVFCVILAKLFIGAFGDRYVVYSIVGFSVLTSLTAAKLYNNSALFSAVLLICFVGWFGLLAFKNYWLPPQSWGAYPEANIQLLKAKGESYLPIVAADPHTFIELAHYAPPEISSRVIYLADPQISLRRLDHNSIEVGMVNLLKPWFKLNVADYQTYIVSHPRFLLCGRIEPFNWITPELEEKGMHLELKGTNGNTLLFLVARTE